METKAYQLTEEQAKTISAALRAQAVTAEEKAVQAIAKGFSYAKEEEAFYHNLKARCESALSVISQDENQEPEEDECPNCGCDYGFCQCEEDEDEDEC
jgi:hypothetical protein